MRKTATPREFPIIPTRVRRRFTTKRLPISKSEALEARKPVTTSKIRSFS